MRYRLKAIEIKSFRGFNASQKIELDSSLVIICGNNGAGKSSITTAIEWALFPKESTTLGEHGIRERIEWPVRHSHTNEEALVKLILLKGDQPLAIEQRSGSKARSSLGGDISNRPRCTYADFKGLAFVHQETIRNFIIDTAQSRTVTFQRLLGAGGIQDLAEIVKESKRALGCDDADQKVRHAHYALQERIKEARVALKTKQEALIINGIQESTQDAATILVLDINSELEEVARHLDLNLGALPPLDPIQTYRNRFRPSIDALKNAGPSQKHKELSVRKTKLERMIAEFETASNALRDKKKLESDAINILGNLESLKSSLKEAAQLEGSLSEQLKNLNDEQAIMRQSLEYFSTHSQADTCPSCLRGDLPKDLVQALKTRIENLSSSEESKIQTEIESSRARKRTFEASKSRLEQLNREVKEAENFRGAKIESLEQLLSHKFQNSESPEAVAKNELSQIDNELQSLKDQVQSLNSRLEQLNDLASRINLIAEALQLQKRIDILSDIQNSDEWKALKNAHEKLSKREAVLSLLCDTLQKLAAGRAALNLARGIRPISEIFHQLTRRSDFPSINIDATNKYSVQLMGNRGSKPIATLNQSDLNALAISVVAGMACTFPEVHDFDFLILDDPSQGMDTESTKSLAHALGKLAEQIQIVVATPDSLFQDELRKATVKKKFIRLRARDSNAAAPAVFLESLEDA